MGVTKIISIKEQLSARLNYVTNSEKTHLATDITYIVNPEKTEQSFFVSAINCLTVGAAYDEMMNTKIRFGKTGGVQGFHIIQSFAPGEVTPEQAHAIGQEFCKRLFGDRFEAILATHLDKAHLHNHIIVNSVSHLDGKKYHASYQHYYREIRSISDALCREYHLKVIDPKGRGEPYAAWKAEKAGQLTLSQMLRNEIDLVIGDCFNFPDFLHLLEKKGYAISRNPNRKYLTVRPPGAKRNIRLDRLGEGYTVEHIKQRIQEQQRKLLEGHSAPHPPLPVRHVSFVGNPHKVPKKKIKGFYALYLRYVYLLRRYRRPTRKKLSGGMRREVLKLERYQMQFLYLHKNGISTLEQLQERQRQIEQEIKARIEIRQPLYWQKKRENNQAIKASLTREIDQQTAALRQLRKEQILCNQIAQKAPEIRTTLREMQNERIRRQKEARQRQMYKGRMR